MQSRFRSASRALIKILLGWHSLPMTTSLHESITDNDESSPENHTTTIPYRSEDIENGGGDQFVKVNREEALNRLRINTEDLGTRQQDKLAQADCRDDVRDESNDSEKILSNVNPFSIDDGDDDDDFEDGIARRYAFEVSGRISGDSRHHIDDGYKYSGGSINGIGNGLENDVDAESPTNSMLRLIRKSSDPRLMLIMVKNFQKEARRRRAERALSANSDFKSRMIMCVASWCDITERKGIILVLGVATLFIALYFLTKSSYARQIIIGVGMSGFFLRLLYRPIYWLLWGRILEQRRLAALKVFDGLNGEKAMAGYNIPIPESDPDFDLEEIDEETGQYNGVVV